MNISSALKEIKLLRNELKRKLKMRQDNFIVIIPKDSNLEQEKDFIPFPKITEEINELMRKISVLREGILKTNINTMVNLEEKKISLAMLKLLIDDTRSALAQLESINDKGIFGYDRRRRITKTEEEEKEVEQLSDLELEKMIKSLEEKKNKFENLLEFTNTNTDLLP